MGGVEGQGCILCEKFVTLRVPIFKRETGSTYVALGQERCAIGNGKSYGSGLARQYALFCCRIGDFVP